MQLGLDVLDVTFGLSHTRLAAQMQRKTRVRGLPNGRPSPSLHTGQACGVRRALGLENSNELKGLPFAYCDAEFPFTIL